MKERGEGQRGEIRKDRKEELGVLTYTCVGVSGFLDTSLYVGVSANMDLCVYQSKTSG